MTLCCAGACVHKVELTEDLVHTCVPGDVIVVAGVVKAMSIEEKKGGGGGKPGVRLDFQV